MKSVLPILAFMTIAPLAGPLLACEHHQIHVAMKTVEAVPAPPPTVVFEPAAPIAPASEIKPADIMSQPLGAAYEGCSRERKNKTVYLTQ
jgi:hypothetical protein